MSETVEDQVIFYTQKAGDVSRQLGVAGLALVWLFHTANVPFGSSVIGTALEQDLRLPTIYIVVSLALDGVQYFIGSALWFWKYVTGSSGVNASTFPLIIKINITLVFLKLLAMIVAYGLIGLIIWNSPLWQ